MNIILIGETVGKLWIKQIDEFHQIKFFLEFW